jgi:hypothetical protein
MKPKEVTIVYILPLPFVLCPLPFAIDIFAQHSNRLNRQKVTRKIS